MSSSSSGHNRAPTLTRSRVDGHVQDDASPSLDGPGETGRPVSAPTGTWAQAGVVKAHLLYRAQDFDFEADLPAGHEELVQDLELTTLLRAMAGRRDLYHQLGGWLDEEVPAPPGC
jgi:hypothetical protein